MEPQLTDFLYHTDTVPDAISVYADALHQYGSIKSIQHALKLNEFRDQYIVDREFLSYVRDEIFNNLYNRIDEDQPDVCFFIEGRRKSLIKFEEKILKLQSEERSLDLLRDMFAFRIIIFGNDSMNLIQKCYNVMHICIDYCIRKHKFILCDTDELTKGAFTELSQRPDIVIPDTCLLLPEYSKCVKDYILYPKENGYQSLHSIFRMADGRCFELQVRTMDMHIHSELGSANHAAHDEERYPDRLLIHPDQIKMDGFYYSKETNTMLDYIGLMKSAQILMRRKSFQ